MSAIEIVLLYFLTGILALLVFDATTKRIRNKLDIATAETQSRMASTGNPMGSRSAKALFVILMWVFWPVVLIGALTERKGGDNSGTKK